MISFPYLLFIYLLNYLSERIDDWCSQSGHEDKEPQNTMIDNITQKKLIYSKKQWKKRFFSLSECNTLPYILFLINYYIF